MAGGILDAIRKDAKSYITKGGFESDITIKTPDSLKTITTTGLASKHHLNFDTDGTSINAKNAHICIDEDDLEVQGYPVRSNNEVSLLHHRISVKDSTGIVKKYIIKETFPDETLGLIVCVLGDFEEVDC